ncbi:Tom40 [Giardia muris]|uniref:Tom40 n=1 Tax=Giardia muris TaxID=5742 RepID=A0A4Z1T1M1_GIAMU|nr:Tom40 [Giardia muris]|eukprot:TNJ27823.1 Tom40 [Giardia muris]
MVLPGLFSRVSPGVYAALGGEASAILGERAYDGMSVVIPGRLSRNWTTQSVLTSNRRAPPVLAQTVAYDSPDLSAQSTLTSRGTFSSSLGLTLLDALTLRASLTAEQLKDTLVHNGRLEAQLEGDDLTLTGLYSIPEGIWACSYLQGLGPRAAVGGEAVHIPQTGMTLYAAGARGTARLGPMKATFVVQGNTERTANASVVADLGSNLQVAGSVTVSARKHDRVRGSASIGFTRRGARSQVTANCNAAGELSCEARKALDDGSVVEVVGSVDIRSGRSTVGVGVVLGSETVSKMFRPRCTD